MSLTQVLYILWRRWRLVASICALVLTAALLFLLLFPARYDAVAQASIDPGQPDLLSNQPSSLGNALLVFQGNMVALVKSNRVALRVIKRLALDKEPASLAKYASSSAVGLIGVDQWLAADLIDHVDAKFSDKGVQSNVMSIAFKSPSAAKSASVANAFLDAFIEASIEMKAAFAQQGAEWFAPQIEKMRSDLIAAQKNLAQFQAETKVIAASTSDSESEQLVAVTSELTKTKTELIALESQLGGSASAAAQSNEAQTVDQTTLGALRSNLTTTNSEIARLQKEVGANNPKLAERLETRKSLLAQIDALIDDNRKRLKERIDERKARVAQLEAARAEQLKNMIEVQNKRNELTSLTREVEFRQSELERVQKSASQAHLQSQLSFTNIAVLDRATPPTAAAFPKPLLVVAAGVVGGLALGLISALLWELLDRRVRFEGDLAHLFGAPVLGSMRSSKAMLQKSRMAALIDRLSAYRPRLPGPPLPGPRRA